MGEEELNKQEQENFKKAIAASLENQDIEAIDQLVKQKAIVASLEDEINKQTEEAKALKKNRLNIDSDTELTHGKKEELIANLNILINGIESEVNQMIIQLYEEESIEDQLKRQNPELTKEIIASQESLLEYYKDRQASSENKIDEATEIAIQASLKEQLHEELLREMNDGFDEGLVSRTSYTSEEFEDIDAENSVVSQQAEVNAEPVDLEQTWIVSNIPEKELPKEVKFIPVSYASGELDKDESELLALSSDMPKFTYEEDEISVVSSLGIPEELGSVTNLGLEEVEGAQEMHFSNESYYVEKPQDFVTSRRQGKADVPVVELEQTLITSNRSKKESPKGDRSIPSSDTSQDSNEDETVFDVTSVTYEDEVGDDTSQILINTPDKAKADKTKEKENKESLVSKLKKGLAAIPKRNKTESARSKKKEKGKNKFQRRYQSMP